MPAKDAEYGTPGYISEYELVALEKRSVREQCAKLLEDMAAKVPHNKQAQIYFKAGAKAIRLNNPNLNWDDDEQ